jgi:GDSL-like Lipase/Acylhydrolase family
MQEAAFADEWAAANLEARDADGPLWVVLGGSASQGVGATTRGSGYVERVAAVLRERDPRWRVVNLSRAGAGVDDVLARQLPELAELTADAPAALVSCVVGAQDVRRRAPGLQDTLRTALAALPPGAVVATVPAGGRDRTAAAVNRLICDEALRHGLRVADLWKGGGSSWRGRWTGLRYEPTDVGHAEWAAAVLAAVDDRTPSRDRA